MTLEIIEKRKSKERQEEELRRQWKERGESRG
jgi:hypothetical protein